MPGFRRMPYFWGIAKNECEELINVYKPKFYFTIQRLITEIRLEKNKDYTPDIKNALCQFEASLSDVKDSFDTDFAIVLQFQYPRLVQNFAEDCRSIIYNYEPTLMAAPGILNKLKAYINSFMEQYLQIKPFFSVEKSALGLNKNFRDKFNATKSSLMPEQPDNEPNDLSLFI